MAKELSAIVKLQIKGGLIGMNQVKKEFSRLGDAFREYFK